MSLFLSDITISFEVDRINNKVNFITLDGKRHTRIINQVMSLVPCYVTYVTYKNKKYITR